MSHVNQFGQNLFDPFIKSGLRLGAATIVPADNFAIPEEAPTLVIPKPAGAAHGFLPEATSAREGLTFLIYNISANTITIKASDDTAFTTTIVLATLEGTLVTCMGGVAKAIGWRALATGLST